MSHAQHIDIITKVLAVTLKKNLLSLQKYMPEAYEAFKNYQEKNIFLTIDENKNINLVKNGNLIYPTDPISETEAQYKKFIASPRHFNYRPNISYGKKLTEDNFLQQHHLQEIADIRANDTDFSAKSPTLPDCIPLLTIIGVGLGYHLEALVQNYDIQHLYVYEPEADIFYCFLHIIDLEPIFKKCTQGNRTITFKIGDSTSGFVNFYPDFFWNNGHFLGCRHYVYRHCHSEQLDEAFVMLHKLIHRTLQGWGFYEDELIGNAHTLLNFQNHYPLLMNKTYVSNPQQSIPAIIVGNGPSLDYNLQDLLRCQPNAVIFSSGSALMALHKAGITPDFHVEIERTLSVDTWIAAIKDADYLKKITFIGLNTIHPQAAKRFKNAIIALKPCDVGALLANEVIASHLPENLVHSNPTVVNGSVATAIAMGFSEIYLFGVDMGFKNKDHHHSKHSGYYNQDNFKIDAPDSFPYPGNFVEEVQSNQDYDFARFQIEHLLQKNPEVRCFNCSDGVKIELSTPLRGSALNIINPFVNKSATLEKIFSEHIYPVDPLIAEKMNARFLMHFSVIKQFLLGILNTICMKPKTLEQMLNIFYEQRKMMLQYKDECPILYILCSGTLIYFQAETTTFAYDYANEKAAMNFVEKAFDVWEKHIFSLLKLTENHYKSPHESYKPYDYFEVRPTVTSTETV